MLGISLLDHPKDIPLIELSSTKSSFKDYLKEFLNPASNEENLKSSVYLKR